MKLIIQIPCYNEAQTLEIALNDLPKHIDGIDEIEYLIINDGSSDNTVEVASKWGVNYIVNFRRNKGLAYGFMAGLFVGAQDFAVRSNRESGDGRSDLLVLPVSVFDRAFVIELKTVKPKKGQKEIFAKNRVAPYKPFRNAD